MNLRDKRASGDFLVKNLETQQTYEIKPRKFLTKRQNRKMLMRPDMVLQFAQYLKDIHAKEGFHHIEVNARIKASLNGRKKQWLIHPNVDLVKINGKTPHKEWIMPLTTPLR